jgi:hypothetical protein
MHSQAIMTEMMRAARNNARTSDEIEVLCADRDSAQRAKAIRVARGGGRLITTQPSCIEPARVEKGASDGEKLGPLHLSRLVRRIAKSLCGSAAIPLYRMS